MIEYSHDIIKHFCVWAPQTKQVVIASKPYIDESKKGAKLLVKWSLDITQTKKKALAEEPKPRGKPQMNPIIKTRIEIPSPEVRDEEEEITILITKTTRKIYESGSYDEAVNDPIHGRRWRKVIKKEL